MASISADVLAYYLLCAMTLMNDKLKLRQLHRGLKCHGGWNAWCKFSIAVLVILLHSGYVICTPTRNDIRLQGGRSHLVGRVEVLHDNIWGTVCDDGFNNTACRVVCRQLGLRGGRCLALLDAAAPSHECIQKTEDHFTAASPSQRIWLGEIMCRGQEQSLTECQHSFWGETTCGHKEDAGCICDPPDSTTSSLLIPVRPKSSANNSRVCNRERIKLFNVTESSEDTGIWLVALQTSDNRWGLVCDDWWDDNAARIICTCLGYTRWKALYNIHHTSTLPVIYNQLQCSVNAHTLDDCNITTSSVHGVRICDAVNEAAAVSCTPHFAHHHSEERVTLNCSSHLMTFCVQNGNANLSNVPTSLVIGCENEGSGVSKYTVNDGFCYIIDMSACQSNTTAVHDNTNAIDYCYDVLYEDMSGLLSRQTGLRLSTASVRRRFCCRLPSVSQRVHAVFQPHNQQPPLLLQEESTPVFVMQCHTDPSRIQTSSTTRSSSGAVNASSSTVRYPVRVNVGDTVYCRVNVTSDMWNEQLQLTLPNCSFTTEPQDKNHSYQFINNNCPTSELLGIEFISESRLSLAFQTRIAKFDNFPHIYIICAARLCDRKSSMCDRSCQLPGRSKRHEELTTATHNDERAHVSQGPFIVIDYGNDTWPVITADGQMLSVFSLMYRTDRRIESKATLITQPLLYVLPATVLLVYYYQ